MANQRLNNFDPNKPLKMGDYSLLELGVIRRMAPIMQMQQRMQGRQQAQGLLGQPKTITTQEEAGPMMPGQGRQQVTAPIAGTGSGFLGSQQTPQDRQALMARLATTPGYESVGIQGLLGGQPKPTTLMQNLEGAGLRPGTQAFQDQILRSLNKPQNQINIGNTKPLGAGASKWRNAKNQAPDPRLTISQAAEMGFRPQTTEQQKSAQAASEAAPIFGDLMKFGFGSGSQKSLFPSENEGAFSRSIGGAKSWLSGVTESDARIALYDSGRNAVVTGIARLVGQVGTLTDRDVDTVRNLLPTPGLTPEPVAKQKFIQIGSLLQSKGVSSTQLKEMGFPPWALSQTVKPPPGFTKKVNP